MNISQQSRRRIFIKLSLIVIVSTIAIITALALLFPNTTSDYQFMTTPNSQAADLSLIISPPCGSPCWQGLILGQTTRQETLAFLQTSKFIAPNPYVASAGIRWQWVEEPGDLDKSNLFSLQSDKLVEVHLIPDIDVTLSDFLNAYGLPDKVILMRRHYGDTSGFNMRILYEKRGIEALWEYIANNLPDDGYVTFAVCPSTNYPVSDVEYLANDIIQAETTHYQIGESRSGFVFAGKDLAQLNGEIWETYCLNIRNF